MRNILYTLFFLQIIVFNNGFAQNSSYWQQEVNSKINVRLDDVHHRLYGNIEMEYINNSPDNLMFIYIHLWMNAYRSLNTAFAKQELRNGSTDFYYANPDERGFIDSLAFTINGQPAKLEIDSVTPDIGKLILNEPLKPGGRITIYTPFRDQLPHTFSRGGHVGNSYQATQWFPKPAVYDKKGWHPLPYLDQGEFYAEFGNYDVSITVPENYVVAATGNLQTESEQNWLNKLADANAEKYEISKEHNADMTALNTGPSVIIDKQSFPVSSKTYKTIRYTQEKVHDFAWFADKRFHVLKSHVTLPNSSKTVTTWAFFLDKRQGLWKYAPRYIDSSVYYYSKWVGPYQYDNCTAVEGPLVAGDGMEYPTITIIGDMQNAMMLETVIAHEVGHNWFQGALGFNERDYPWMDEGINSYYERRYVEERYPHYNALSGYPGWVRDFLGIDSISSNYQNYFLPLFQERRHEDQPICLKSVDFTEINYGVMVYAKMPYSMRYLEKYLGTAEFDRVMQQFYTEWKLKHPQPEDLQDFFNKQTGKELDWYFDDLLCTTKRLDYKILHAKDTITIGGRTFIKIGIRNTGEIKGPFSISAYKNDSIVATIWYNGFFGTNEMLFPYDNYDGFRIDAIEVMPEYNRHNNTLRANGVLKKIEPFRFQPLGSIEDPYRTELYFSPAYGYNKYDGSMVGVALYNSFIPVKNTEYLFIPMYSTNTNKLQGIGRINVFIYPKTDWIQYLEVMSSGSMFAFSHQKIDSTNYYNGVKRISTQLNLKLKNTNPNLSNIFTTRYIYLNEQFENYFVSAFPTPNTVTILQQPSSLNISQFKYQLTNLRKVNPFSLEITAEDTRGFSQSDNIRGEFKYRFNYNAKRGLDVRLFSEYGSKDSYITLFSNGFTDYAFDHYFIGRSETTGLSAHQIYDGFGFMKFNPSLLLSSLGQARSFASAINLESELPIPFFILFVDGGYYDVNPNQLLSNTLYDAGIGLRIIPNIFEIYLPLFVSTDIKNNIYTLPGYNTLLDRIMFTLQLEKLDVFKIIREARI